MNKIDQHLGLRISEARQESAIRESDAAAALELSIEEYSRLEKGEVRVDARSLAILARLLKRPIGWFYSGLPGQSVFDKSASGR